MTERCEHAWQEKQGKLNYILEMSATVNSVFEIMRTIVKEWYKIVSYGADHDNGFRFSSTVQLLRSVSDGGRIFTLGVLPYRGSVGTCSLKGYGF